MKSLRSIFFACYLLITGILFLSTADASQGEDFFLGRIIKDDVAIRSGYSENFNSVLFLNKDDFVVICGKNFSWYKVMLPPDADCYLCADFVEETGKTTGFIKANKLNIRGGPDTKFGIVGHLKKDDEVVIKKREGGWYKILPPETAYGWIYKDYVFNAGSAQAFLEKRKLLNEFEGKFRKFERHYQKSLSAQDQLLSLENVLKKLDSLLMEYSNCKENVIRLQKKKDLILEKIKSFGLVEQISQLREQNIIEAEGKIQDLGKFLGKRGTHKLIKDSKTLFYLESEEINLNVFSNRPVRVWGFIEGDRQASEPLLRVEKLILK